MTIKEDKLKDLVNEGFERRPHYYLFDIGSTFDTTMEMWIGTNGSIYLVYDDEISDSQLNNYNKKLIDLYKKGFIDEGEC